MYLQAWDPWKEIQDVGNGGLLQGGERWVVGRGSEACLNCVLPIQKHEISVKVFKDYSILVMLTTAITRFHCWLDFKERSLARSLFPIPSLLSLFKGPGRGLWSGPWNLHRPMSWSDLHVSLHLADRVGNTLCCEQSVESIHLGRSCLNFWAMQWCRLSRKGHS